MADAAPVDGTVRAADGTPLKVKLRLAERRERLRALSLIAPLFLFIVISFLVPIVQMLSNAVYDTDIGDTLPATSQLLRGWDGKDVPGEEIFSAFAAEMKVAQANKTAALIGKRLNYEVPTLKSKVTVTARKLGAIKQGPWKEAVIGLDPVWGELSTWAVIKRASGSITTKAPTSGSSN